MSLKSRTFVANGGVAITWTASNALFGGVDVILVGAQGGAGIGGGPGGKGGLIAGNIEISSGQQLDITVGSQGGQGTGGGGLGFTDGADGGTGGLGDGGAGGGSSGIAGGATPPTGFTTGQTMAVAGAGGGGGGMGGPDENYKTAQGWFFAQGGFGGINQQAGFVGYDNTGGSGHAGAGASQAGAGGAAGSGGSGATAGTSETGSTAGPGGSGATSAGGSGGGGGAGVATGCGGGGGGGQANAQGGGGSGGSSYRHSGNWAFTDNVQSGDGYVTLTWTEADAPITANATPQNNSNHDALGRRRHLQLGLQPSDVLGHPDPLLAADPDPRWHLRLLERLGLLLELAGVDQLLVDERHGALWGHPERRRLRMVSSDRGEQQEPPGPVLARLDFHHPRCPDRHHQCALGSHGHPAARGAVDLDPRLGSRQLRPDQVPGPHLHLGSDPGRGLLPGHRGALYDSTLTASAHEYDVTSGVTYTTGNTYVAFVHHPDGRGRVGVGVVGLHRRPSGAPRPEPVRVRSGRRRVHGERHRRRA